MKKKTVDITIPKTGEYLPRKENEILIKYEYEVWEREEAAKELRVFIKRTSGFYADESYSWQNGIEVPEYAIAGLLKAIKFRLGHEIVVDFSFDENDDMYIEIVDDYRE